MMEKSVITRHTSRKNRFRCLNYEILLPYSLPDLPYFVQWIRHLNKKESMCKLTDKYSSPKFILCELNHQMTKWWMMIFFKQFFMSQGINWWTGVVWITCGLLWFFNQMFGLSFWRHPFTAEDPLVSKWCNAKLKKKTVLMKKQTHLHIGWTEAELIFTNKKKKSF